MPFHLCSDGQTICGILVENIFPNASRPVGYAIPVLIQALPLIVGVLPIAGVTAAYWLNVEVGVLPSCMPYLDGCTSISSTGRYMPGAIVFRAALLPQAAFLAVLWWCSVEWLRSVSPAAKSGTVIKLFGMTGAVALVVYVVFLGTNQPFYEFMRRFGIYFYFLGTAIAQLSLSLSLNHSRLRQAMLWVIITPFVLGVLNLVQKLIVTAPNNIQNRVEWIAALCMQVWFVLLYQAWRQSHLDVSISAERR